MQHRLVAGQAGLGDGRQVRNSAERLAPVTASARTLLPSRTRPAALAMVLNIMRDVAADQIVQRRPEPL